MSIVFGGRQRELDRQVAVKFLAPQLFADATSRRRFLQEARLTARIVHPHVVGIFDFGERNGVPYIVLEYLPGDSVKRRIRTAGALGTKEALELAKQALLGMAAAHELGIVHRDIKSENLLLTADGQVKVTDFGIAKAAGGAGLVHTMPEILLGTPATMSPEQARGEPVTPQSDLYSMGVVLFEMLTGQLPFLGDTPTAILVKHIREPAPRLAQLRPGSPPELEELLERALAKDPAQRFASASEFAEAVDGLLLTLPSDPGTTTRRTALPAPADSVSATSVVQTGGALTPASGQTVRWKKEKL
jgi:serine/threonine-protein kinase